MRDTTDPISIPLPDHVTEIAAHLASERPDAPFYVFSETLLAHTASRFLRGFPGEVTYAVKANDGVEVLLGLARAGLQAFDVASIAEIEHLSALLPEARLHYHNPVRSEAEIAAAKSLGVKVFSVDSVSSLDRLGALSPDCEVSVRLRLPVAGAEYDFGEKFGADPDEARALLERLKERGVKTSMTFHPGTQCEAASAWASYIHACAEIARASGTELHRLNVGGGFAAQRAQVPPDWEAVFSTIGAVTQDAFGQMAPQLVCEPGRAMVSEAYTLVLRVKDSRARDGALFMNDGHYGALAEVRDIGLSQRAIWLSPDGMPRSGVLRDLVLYGPTCDSLDRVDAPVAVPQDVTMGDYMILPGMGAYTLSLTTRFNGYGAREILPQAALAKAGHCATAG